MLTDVAALGMSVWRFVWRESPLRADGRSGFNEPRSSRRRSMGLPSSHRATIGVEATPTAYLAQHVNGGLLLIVAIVGAVINVIATGLLKRTNQIES